MTWLLLWPFASLTFLFGYVCGALLSRAGTARLEADANEVRPRVSAATVR